MYDYVLQYGFDNKSSMTIQEIKDYLKANGIKDRERKWLPHITIDLYDCKNEEEFLSKLDSIVKDIKQFDIDFRKLNSFYNETLYIEPHNKEILLDLKQLFNEKLDIYMQDKRRTRKYMPHATLCTSNCIEKSIKLAKDKFVPFVARVKYIWVYNSDMVLIKEYKLNNY